MGCRMWVSREGQEFRLGVQCSADALLVYVPSPLGVLRHSISSKRAAASVPLRSGAPLRSNKYARAAAADARSLL